jgi:hypothetical protein
MEGISADWRKSSYSGTNGGQCVEVGTWRKSTHSASNGGACIEVGGAEPGILVRDTTDRAGGVLALPAAAWCAFLTEIRA